MQDALHMHEHHSAKSAAKEFFGLAVGSIGLTVAAVGALFLPQFTVPAMIAIAGGLLVGEAGARAGGASLVEIPGAVVNAVTGKSARRDAAQQELVREYDRAMEPAGRGHLPAGAYASSEEAMAAHRAARYNLSASYQDGEIMDGVGGGFDMGGGGNFVGRVTPQQRRDPLQEAFSAMPVYGDNGHTGAVESRRGTPQGRDGR